MKRSRHESKLTFGIYHPLYRQRLEHFVSKHSCEEQPLSADQLIEARHAEVTTVVFVAGILIVGETQRGILGDDGATMKVHKPCPRCDVVLNLADDLFGAQCKPDYQCSCVISIKWHLLVGKTLFDLDVERAGKRFESMAVHGLPLYAKLKLGKTYQLVGWTLRKQENRVPPAFKLPLDIVVDEANRTIRGLPLIDAGSWPRRSYKQDEWTDPHIDMQRGLLITRGDTLRLALRDNPKLGLSGLDVLRLVATLWRHLGPHLPDAAPLERPDADDLVVPDSIWLFVAYNDGDSERNRVAKTPTGQLLIYTNKSIRLLAIAPELKFEVL